MAQELKWKTSLEEKDLKRTNFSALVSIADAMLDAENWPVEAIVVKDGIVVNQSPVYTKQNSQKVVYEIEDMVGWSMYELNKWLALNYKFNNSPEATENTFAFLEE